MTWRPMRSLAILDDPRAGLRGQVNALAPGRSKASDGLIGDSAHASTSGHYPHTVPGVGTEIVTAWDCTNDPAGGCNARTLAEVLRRHRDPRIRYVISEREIFSSYASGSRTAWEWGPYSGIDPHINHGHFQVLDAPISDTTTPWNLEGFAMLTPEDITAVASRVWNWDNQDGPAVEKAYVMLLRAANAATAAETATKALTVQLAKLDGMVQQLLDRPAGGGDGSDAVAIAEVLRKVEALTRGVQANAVAVTE